MILRWAIAFFLLALIAAFFGFTDVAVVSSDFARILFYLFIVLFVFSLIYYLITGRTPPTPNL